ncbi:MAG: hypothetical protein GEU93_12645 [Propionibacteriales bacterium]|nr:hypothetical protein [Propionibacteriales bacterium]
MGAQESTEHGAVPSPRDAGHVRLLFGSHVIAEYWADSERAALYADVIGRRFAGLRVENVPASVDPGQLAPLPEEWLWNLPPR